MLRLFNDCFAVLFLFTAIHAFQRRQWTIGSIVLSLGIGVKMSVLVALPGALLVLGLALPTAEAVRKVVIMVGIQVSLIMLHFNETRLQYSDKFFSSL